MTFVLSGEVRISGKTAKAEIKDLEQSQDRLKKSTKNLSTEGKKAAAINRRTGVTARQAATDYDRLSVAERRAANEAMTMGQASKHAAGHTRGMAGGMRNLGLQLNQVAQVGGMTGNWMQAFAVQLPDMLLGFGAVGIGAGILAGAMIPLFNSWADGGDKAESLEDAMGDLSDQMESYVTAAGAAEVSTEQLQLKFGEAAGTVRALLDRMVEEERRDLKISIGASIETAVGTSEFGVGNASISSFAEKSMRDFFGTRSMGTVGRQHKKILAELYQNYTNLGAAADASTSVQIDAMESLISSFEKAARASGGITQAEHDRLAVYQELLLKMYEMQGLEEDPGADAAIKERSAAAVQFFQEVLQARHDQQVAAEETLETMRKENTLLWAQQKFGEGSVEVAVLRQEAERAVFEEMLAAENATEATKDEMRAAFQEKQKFEAINIASGISAAVDQAVLLSEQLGIAVNEALSLQNLNSHRDSRQYSGRGGDPRDYMPGGSKYGQSAAWKPSKKRGGGGSDQQAQALSRLLEQQQLQLDVLRETDPVLREMLRHRKALAGASDEERAALRDLIGARLDEEDALKSNGELHDTFRDSLYSSIQGLTLEGEKAVDVLENIGMAIANAALQAALLGEGPLAQIFGLSGGGGLLGTLATSLFPGAAIPAAAGGGRLSGPGTGTSDDILMWGSDGEFMVNAAATARHLPLLEALNSNAPIPAFAAGGMVSPPSVRRSGGHAQSELPPIVEINNYGSTPISGEAEHSVDSSGRRHVSMELADAVGNAMTTPGGGAKKVLRNKYNVKQRGTRR